MALEIERRFLVRSDAWRSSAGPAQPLRQGYLAASADAVTVRMRLCGSDQAWLTLKAAADAVGLVRYEFEYPIPVADAEALWDLAPHRLDKVRYPLDCLGGDWVVDCFQGDNAPLVLAEVELASAQRSSGFRPGAARRSPGNPAGAMLCWPSTRFSLAPEQRRRFGWP